MARLQTLPRASPQPCPLLGSWLNASIGVKPIQVSLLNPRKLSRFNRQTLEMKRGRRHPGGALTIIDWNENDDSAYILEVDLEYPKELHNEHSDYPLAPENMNVKEEFLSEHQRTLHKHYYNGKDEKQPKLMPNVMDKEKYVVHIKAL